MLGGIFSFRGRVNRLQYLFGNVGIGVFVAVVCLALVVGKGPRDVAAVVPLILLMALPVGLIAVWTGLSLQARRIRDIGWNPAVVLPLWFVADLVDKAFLPGFPHLNPLQWSQQSMIGGLINLGLGAALAFWPGNGGGADDNDHAARISFDIPEPAAPAYERARPAYDHPAFERSTPRPTPPPAPAAPAHGAAPVFGRAPAPGGFGRRGL